LQALLAGWVVYVGAAGMLFEAIVLLLSRRRLNLDFPPALAALALYLIGLWRSASLILGANAEPTFHWTVLLVAAWTGVRWWWTRVPPEPPVAR
jgi:hypothetical protein